MAAEGLQTHLARKDFAPEAAARTMVALATAHGEPQFAQCVHDHYFGAPLHLRQTLWRAWDQTDESAAGALLIALREICSKEFPHIAPSEAGTWLRAGNAAMLLEPETVSAIGAAAEMVTTYFKARGDDLLARCAADRQASGVLAQALQQQSPKLPVSLAVYEAYRSLCGLNPDGPAARDLSLPPTPDIATVARERLMIVQDFRICESASETEIKGCIQRAYQTRSKQIYNQLLSRDE